jgi:two-component system phosphate regulon sensor histidine kinase PhoR
MEHLTADLLTLVSLEEGDRIPFAMQETLVYPLLQEAADSVEPAARKKNITLSLNCPADLKAVLYGPFIIQGAINLLDNGVKYSPEGSKVRLEATAQAGELVIAVRDKGIGIAPRHLKRIFERFYRVDPARSRSHGGAGLGLAIVRHIASIHRGVAEAESHAGEGSIFRIRIPLK